MSDQTQEPWHTRDTGTVLDALATTREGLSREEAAARLDSAGPNTLPEPQRQHWFRRFLRQFANILIYVLLVSAGITLLLGHLTDSLVILAVVLANAVIGFVQEGKAEKAIEAIRQMLAPEAQVLRGGHRRSVPAEELVPGDVVFLEAGDRVPADLRLLDVHGLRIQEAILTGESVAVEKQSEPVERLNAPVAERPSLAYSGTLVTRGQGRGVVIATGASTEIGRISGMLSEIETLETPLVVQMDKFAKWLTGVILGVAVFLLAFGYFVREFDFAELFMAVVGLSVAAIPEGLPAVLTITLAIGVQSMARRKAIVRRLPAIETLGAVSVICTDKTGTLTRNEMTVVSARSRDQVFVVDGDGYDPEGAITGEHGDDIEPRPVLAAMGSAAALCNDASLHQDAGGWTVSGDPMEGALLAFAGKVDLDVERERSLWSRSDAIPFDAGHRFMATLNHDHHGHACVYVKGAPEKLLDMCTAQRGPDGDSQPLERQWWGRQVQEIAAEGQRVLALAAKPVSPEKTVLEFDDLEDGLELLGLVGLIDPPRQEAIDAIAECYRAGISVKMITGDHARTSAAIGRQIGLQHTEQVLTGSEIDAMGDDELARGLPEIDIFARTSPEHKLRLVMALQAGGMTVAMTGDGVNDAPALKRADVGIAMGKKGSEAAKEAAELVLADDNFASIVAAVREGRTVYDNLKKVISWTLPTSAGEAMTIVVALLFGLTLPVTPVQILWINLITVATLGIALAFEPTEAGTMKQPPRSPTEPLLGRELAWYITLVSILFMLGVFWLYFNAVERGYSIELARTLVVNALVMMEIFQLFFIRNIYGTSLSWKVLRGTRIIWLLVGIVVVAQLAITYLPPLQFLFDTRPLGLTDIGFIVGVGLATFVIVEVDKQVRLRAGFLLARKYRKAGEGAAP